MTKNEKLKHRDIVFGPVVSRRLGYSLGVDLVPHKTCSLNCVYCECGATTDLTLERKIFVPTNLVLEKIETVIKNNSQKIDYLTFSGSGEPTLALNIGEIINYLKNNYPQYKIAVLTNGTLLFQTAVRKDLLNADLVVPTLNSLSLESFKKINRPHHDLDLTKIVEGLVKFREEFKHEIWLEVFIIPGINDSEPELTNFKKELLRLNPDKIQINTLDRPGTESWVTKPNEVQLKKIAVFLQPYNVELVNQVSYKSPDAKNENNFIEKEASAISEKILATLLRRPSRKQDLISGLSVSELALTAALEQLMKKGQVVAKKQGKDIFYGVL